MLYCYNGSDKSVVQDNILQCVFTEIFNDVHSPCQINKYNQHIVGTLKYLKRPAEMLEINMTASHVQTA